MGPVVRDRARHQGFAVPPRAAVGTAVGLSFIPVEDVELVAQPHGALKSAGKPASHPTKPTAVFTAVGRARGPTIKKGWSLRSLPACTAEAPANAAMADLPPKKWTPS